MNSFPQFVARHNGYGHETFARVSVILHWLITVYYPIRGKNTPFIVHTSFLEMAVRIMVPVTLGVTSKSQIHTLQSSRWREEIPESARVPCVLIMVGQRIEEQDIYDKGPG